MPDNKKPIGRNEDVLYTVLLSPTPHTAFIIYLVLKDPTTLTDAIGSHFCRGSRFIFERKKKIWFSTPFLGEFQKQLAGQSASQLCMSLVTKTSKRETKRRVLVHNTHTHLTISRKSKADKSRGFYSNFFFHAKMACHDRLVYTLLLT